MAGRRHGPAGHPAAGPAGRARPDRGPDARRGRRTPTRIARVDPGRRPRAGRAERDAHGRRGADRRPLVPAPAARGVPHASRGRAADGWLARSSVGRRGLPAAAGHPDPPRRRRRVGRASRRPGRRRSRRLDRRRPLGTGRRAAPAGHPWRPPRLRLGSRRAGRRGRDACPRGEAAGRGPMPAAGPSAGVRPSARPDRRSQTVRSTAARGLRPSATTGAVGSARRRHRVRHGSADRDTSGLRRVGARTPQTSPASGARCVGSAVDAARRSRTAPDARHAAAMRSRSRRRQSIRTTSTGADAATHPPADTIPGGPPGRDRALSACDSGRDRRPRRDADQEEW